MANMFMANIVMAYIVMALKGTMPCVELWKEFATYDWPTTEQQIYSLRLPLGVVFTASLYSYGPTWLWSYAVMALSSYGLLTMPAIGVVFTASLSSYGLSSYGPM